MEILEIKKLFLGRFTYGNSKSERVITLKNEIEIRKKQLLNNIDNLKLKNELVELLIMNAIIEFYEETYPFEIIEQLYKLTQYDIRVLILELRTENWAYGEIREKTITKIDEFIKNNKNIPSKYLSILKYFKAFYECDNNNLNNSILYIKKSINYWKQNASAYRLYAHLLKKLGNIDKSIKIYETEKSYKAYYKIKLEYYNHSDFDTFLYIIAQNVVLK